MTKTKTTSKRKGRRRTSAIIRRQHPDELVEFRLVIVCPGCGRRDCTGLTEEVESKIVICGYCGTRSGPMPVIERVKMSGGKREGAGRKASRGEAKPGRNVRLSPIVWLFLAESSDSANNQIEDAIRRTKAFREWLAARN